MIKISRRGYTQHLRLLFITTQRVYNITKKNPYPKEGLLFHNILGITCSPYSDGFMCIHTKEVHEDRVKKKVLENLISNYVYLKGDWLVLVDHPCEFVTQLFMAMGRDNNDDNFLKFESKYKEIFILILFI